MLLQVLQCWRSWKATRKHHTFFHQHTDSGVQRFQRGFCWSTQCSMGLAGMCFTAPVSSKTGGFASTGKG